MQIRTALVTNMIQKPTINRNTRNITAVWRQINNLCQKRFGLTNIRLAMRTRRMKLRVGQWPSLLPTTVNITQLLPGQHRSQRVRGVLLFLFIPASSRMHPMVPAVLLYKHNSECDFISMTIDIPVYAEHLKLV